MSPDRQLWIDMLAHLRRAHPAICRHWFEELEALGVAGGTLNLRAQSAIHRDYLKRTCSEAFNDALRTVSGRLLSIRFVGPEDDWGDAPAIGPIADQAEPAAASEVIEETARPEPPVVESPLRDPAEVTLRVEVKPIATLAETPGREAGPSRVTEHRRRADEGLAINPDYDFGNFVVGPGNRLAHAAAVAVGESQGRQYNPLFIHGGVGLGKTHLLQAACLRILERTPHARVYYTSCEGFMTQFMESVQSGQMSDFRHRYRDIDVLVVDDIHFLAKRDRTQEEFFHTFNNLYQAGKQILLSSDAAPEEIPDLEDRLVSRFKWGLVAKIDPPCYETRVAILKTKAKVRGLEFPDDCACFIAARIDSNIRELEGAITRVQIVASVENKPIDLALVKGALGDLNDEAPPEPSIQQIITAVTDYYRIRLSDLQSKRRPRSVTIPRQVCMFLARRMTKLSLEEIGGYFGGRDHTTVMHAVKAIDQRRESDDEFVGQLRAIEERIRASG
ncbi:MAG TPA: chromosomal replication initiator protein DnaA [Phycisphaerales bacterium]